MIGARAIWACAAPPHNDAMELPALDKEAARSLRSRAAFMMMRRSSSLERYAESAGD